MSRPPVLAPDSKWHYALSLVLGLAAVFWHAASLAPIRYHYAPDSVAYIEAARNLAHGELPVFNSPIDDEGSASAPIALFPPGFPLLIYSGSAISGLNASVVSVSINWIAWALLPAILLFALRPVANVWAAHLVGVLVSISPGITQYGWLAHSDTPFLLLVISSFGLLLRGCPDPGRPVMLFFSGLLCGFAYLTRNAGIAFIAATIGSFGLLALTRVLSAHATISRLAYWLAGACLIVVPFLAWNLTMFGSFQPYEMPPSDIGLLTNVRTYLQALLLDISAVPPIAQLAWAGKVLLIMTVLALILTWRAWPQFKAIWKHASQNTNLALLCLGSYFILGAAMVIIARTRYQWGETINLRHVLQYSWAFFAASAVLIAGTRSKSAYAVAFVIALALLGSRVVYGQVQRARELDTYNSIAGAPDPLLAARTLPNRGALITAKLKLVVARDTGLLAKIRDYPSSTTLVSNFADVFEIETGRTIRGLELGDTCSLTKVFDNLPARLGTRGDIRILISPDNGMLRSGCWEKLRSVSVSGYRSTLGQPNVLELAPAGNQP